VDVSNNSDQLVRKTINLHPVNIDSINGFVTYLFDSTMVVGPGNIWIGWIQNDATLLGLGVDRNTVSTGNMSIFFGGHWRHSQVVGSWMMRPVFGDSILLSGIEQPIQQALVLFPNPASDYVYVSTGNSEPFHFNYQ